MGIDRWAKSTASEKGGIGVGGTGKQQKQASKIIINKFIYWTYSEVELNQASKIIIIYLLDFFRGGVMNSVRHFALNAFSDKLINILMFR